MGVHNSEIESTEHSCNPSQIAYSCFNSLDNKELSMVFEEDADEGLITPPILQTVNPQFVIVDLGKSDTQKLFSREIRAAHLTGHAENIQAGSECNVVESLLQSVSIETGKFLGCDWKDTSIRDSRFMHCTFSSASLAYNSLNDVVFEASRFDDADFQNCDFDHVTFVECTFLRSLIKTCSFRSCKFLRCDTNNKLFETCRFIECQFSDTIIQIQTIAENFGLAKSSYCGPVRSDRTEASAVMLSVNDLKKWNESATAQPLHKANIEYFLLETFIDGSDYLDVCLALRSWLPQFRTSKSFVVVLNQWVDFLLWLYRTDGTTIHTIVAAHTMTGELLSALHDLSQNHATLASISGDHLALSQTVDGYLELVELCSICYREAASLLVEGNGDLAEYAGLLKPMLASGEVQLLSVVPHNSPWDLALSFGSAHGTMLFFAFFLATRTHFELSQIRAKVPPSGTSSGSAESPVVPARLHATAEPLLSIDLGMIKQSTTGSQLRFRAYLPGNLLAELSISVGSGQIAKLRKTVKGLL
jgi:fluoroquinolone resistance protein